MSVLVGVVPISIGHLPISLSLSLRVGTAPILISHSSCQFEWGSTYIDRSSHCLVNLVFGTAPISNAHCFVKLSWVLFASESRLHSWGLVFGFESLFLWVFDVQSHFSSVVSFRVAVLGIIYSLALHMTFMVLHLSSFFLISLPCAYHLFIIGLPDFPFHYTWHSSLSSWRIFRSCCWAPYTWHPHIVHIG